MINLETPKKFRPLIGRSMFIATWCAWSRRGRSFFGSSRLIIREAPRLP